MKIIFKIARAELRTLFYSPVAWLTIIVFFTFAGIQFISPLENLARIQETKLANSPGWRGFDDIAPLTYTMFSGSLSQILAYLYLFIPLLTMGVINREYQSGTMKLLSSSPVSIREIVLGKYLGLVLFSMVLLTAVAFLLFTGYFTIQYAEFKWYLSMLLGIFLYSCCTMAIGLYISSLTQYQIVAGIVTFLVFFLLNVIGNFWQQYDILRDITYFLSLSGRTENMISGLITSRDLFYFILIVVFFLGLTMIRLKSKQESKSWKVSCMRNLALITVILSIGYFSGRPGRVGYLDVTRDQRNTLDTATQAVLREMDGSPLTVTLFTNLLGSGADKGIPQSRNRYVWGTWERIRRFYPDIRLKYEYYYETRPGEKTFDKTKTDMSDHEQAYLLAKMMHVDTADFKKPGEISKLVDLSREDKLSLVMQLEYKGKKSFMRFLTSARFTEPISGAVRRLTRDQVPSVLFTTGHYERSPWRNGEREYGKHTNFQANDHTLINTGMDADTVSLLHSPVPANTNLLVVADPKSALSNKEQEHILRFIEQGGNTMFYAEPGKQQILNPVLAKLGVQLESGILVRSEKNRLAHQYWGIMTNTGNNMAREFYMQINQKLGEGDVGAIMEGACLLNFKDTAGFKAEPIITVRGNKNSWVEKGVYVYDSAAPVFSPQEGDVQHPEYVVGLRLSRTINNKEQRIIVVGDADFMNKAEGGSIKLGLYSWLVNNEYPVYKDFILPKDIRLNVGKNAAKLLGNIYVYLIPGVLLLTGTIILIRRKRK